MPPYSRRELLQAAVAGALVSKTALKGQTAPAAVQVEPVYPYNARSTVSLIRGENRRKLVHDALVAIDADIKPKLKNKKYVLIKPNMVSTKVQLAATHVDTLHGILDYLAPRFKGPVVIAESSAQPDTAEGFEVFQYNRLVAERKDQKVSLIDLNREGKYQVHSIVDRDIRVVPVRLAARLFDPEAFVLCSAMLKTHNAVVATLSIKNMVIGAPLHSAPKETPAWHDKRRYHAGPHQMNYSMMLTAQVLKPNFGAAVVDGFEGMEGNGPTNGTMVPSRCVLASTDYLAVDRVGVEAMGLDANKVGYLRYCGQIGLGQYDLSKIDVRGDSIASVQRTYKLHDQVNDQLKWMIPLADSIKG